jgi:YVTN family beta-propeller protein
MTRTTMTALFASVAALSALALSPALAQTAPAYTVVKSVPLGAPDGYDYVVFDPASHRAYVAHGDGVTVIDGRDGRTIGKIEGIPGGTHGIGISAATGKGYTDDGKAGLGVAFDLKTLKTGARIPAAEDADAVAFDPVTGHIFVVNGDSASITVIDPKTDKAVATIAGGGKLEYAVADDRGHLFVNGAGKRDIVRINTRTNAVEGHWPIPDCASPHGLAIDKVGHRLFVSCVNSLMTVVNADTGAVVAAVPIGKGTDAAAYDPKRHLVFSSNGVDGTLSVILQKNVDTYVPAATIPTAVSARTMSIDPETGRLYIVALDTEPAATPGARPRPRPGTLRLMFLDPSH